jgi:alpha-glucosidase
MADDLGPDWWREGVDYQIYPRSFSDSSGDGLGDLGGIIERLDYLNDGTPRSLGVDAIWLSPIYPSPDYDFGYDVSDYVAIDPRYGTLADFERLVAEAHRRGIRVVLDLVLNHSSHQHPWFEASRASRTGPFADWYVWADPGGRAGSGRPRPPNNWRSYFGGPAWTWEPARNQFYLHTFLPQQPELNWRNPDVRAAMLNVVRTWLDRGVDGFRLDVFNVFFKDARLRSNPPRVGGRGAWSWQRHLHDRNQPELLDVLEELRGVVDEAAGRMTVGELFDGTIAQAAEYTAPRHLVFDFSLLATPWGGPAFAEAVRRRESAFGPDRWPTVVLSNHDQPRHASRYDDRRYGEARAKVAAALLLTLRGSPFLYYGEEIALRNVPIPNAQAVDPPARRSSLLFPWWNRDQARTPMPWTSGPAGGFTTGQLWLPQGPDVERRNVAAQDADEASVLSFYRRLIWLRRGRPALRGGSFEMLSLGEDDALGYLRRADGQTAAVLLGFEGRPLRVRLPACPSGGPWRVALSTHREAGDRIGGQQLVLEPLEALILLDD